MSSQPLGGTNPSQKRKLLSTSTPKRKKIQPNNVQNLCKFLSDKNVPSVVRKKNNSVNSTFLSDKISQINQTFLFMLATSKEMAFVQPVIIKIDETSLEDKEFIKCRIDASYFVGRVVATSNTLSKLESTISDVVDKFAVGWKANLLKKDMLIMCCTTIVKIQDIEESDQRIQFLSTILPASSNITVNLNSTALDKDASSSSFWGDLSSVVQESDSGLVQSENEASLGIENTGESLHHNSGSLDVDSSSNINMIEGEEDEDEDITPDVHDVSSASDDELSVNNENECKRKRRKRLITTTQLITKLRQEQKQGLLKANSEITSLTSMLDEAMPTLPIENPLTPILKKIYKFIQALNFKFNNMNEKAIADGTIALDRTIKVSKVKDKEEISINGIMNFPLSLYGWSITASEPRLVMSRLMRVCIPDSLKNGSQVSDEANEKNFIYRIGDESLNGTDRLENGREKIQTLIELCHSVKNFDCMTFQSYNACKAQIIKALYDFNRAKQKKTALPTTRKSKKQKALESELSVSNQSKETEDNENAVVNYLFKTMHSQS